MAKVRLVSKSFSELMRPIIFRIFTIRPFVTLSRGGEADPTVLPLTQADVERTISRLDFFTSSLIAPHVKHIRVYPVTGPSNFDSTGDKDFILDALFKRMPQLVSIQALHIEDLPFSEKAIRGLCDVSHILSRIDIHDSWICGGANRAAEGVLHADMLNIRLTRSRSYAIWTRYLQANSVGDIRLWLGDHPVAEAFMETVGSLPLTHLTMTYNYRRLLVLLQEPQSAIWDHLVSLCLHLDYVSRPLLELICSRCRHLGVLNLTIKNRSNGSVRTLVPNEGCTVQASKILLPCMRISE